MNRKKKQEANKEAGDRLESLDDIEDEDVLWDDESGDPAERPHRKAKTRGRDKAPRAGPKRRSFDDDSVDGG
jgi:hypothetical protein